MAGELVDKRRSPWWMCVLALVIAAFFGWVIFETQTKPVSDSVWSHVLIPPYAVWIYLVLACLLNCKSTVVTRHRILVSNGPIPLGANEEIPRERVACSYYYGIITASDGGGDEGVAIGYVAGIETTDGRQLDLVEYCPDLSSARDLAQAIARALNAGSVGGSVVSVRFLDRARTDPVDIRLAWMWAGIWAGAFAAGAAWEIAYRWRVI